MNACMAVLAPFPHAHTQDFLLRDGAAHKEIGGFSINLNSSVPHTHTHRPALPGESFTEPLFSDDHWAGDVDGYNYHCNDKNCGCSFLWKCLWKRLCFRTCPRHSYSLSANLSKTGFPGERSGHETKTQGLNLEQMVADGATVEVRRIVDTNPWEASKTPLRLLWTEGLQCKSEVSPDP